MICEGAGGEEQGPEFHNFESCASLEANLAAKQLSKDPFFSCPPPCEKLPPKPGLYLLIRHLDILNTE